MCIVCVGVWGGCVLFVCGDVLCVLGMCVVGMCVVGVWGCVCGCVWGVEGS